MQQKHRDPLLIFAAASFMSQVPCVSRRSRPAAKTRLQDTDESHREPSLRMSHL